MLYDPHYSALQYQDPHWKDLYCWDFYHSALCQLLFLTNRLLFSNIINALFTISASPKKSLICSESSYHYSDNTSKYTPLLKMLYIPRFPMLRSSLLSSFFTPDAWHSFSAVLYRLNFTVSTVRQQNLCASPERRCGPSSVSSVTSKIHLSCSRARCHWQKFLPRFPGPPPTGGWTRACTDIYLHGFQYRPRFSFFT